MAQDNPVGRDMCKRRMLMRSAPLGVASKTRSSRNAQWVEGNVPYTTRKFDKTAGYVSNNPIEVSDSMDASVSIVESEAPFDASIEGGGKVDVVGNIMDLEGRNSIPTLGKVVNPFDNREPIEGVKNAELLGENLEQGAPEAGTAKEAGMVENAATQEISSVEYQDGVRELLIETLFHIEMLKNQIQSRGFLIPKVDEFVEIDGRDPFRDALGRFHCERTKELARMVSCALQLQNFIQSKGLEVINEETLLEGSGNHVTEREDTRDSAPLGESGLCAAETHLEAEARVPSEEWSVKSKGKIRLKKSDIRKWRASRGSHSQKT